MDPMSKSFIAAVNRFVLEERIPLCGLLRSMPQPPFITV